MPAVNQFRVISSSDLRPDLPGYRSRTIFPKTRTGCGACKAKKVKCDEGKPICLRCQRNNRQCRYSRPLEHSFISPSAIPAVLLLEHSDCSRATSGRQLLHHCRTYWREIFPGFYENDNFLLAFKSSELVRATCHAIAASHLRHLCPDDKAHAMAEYSQRALAMKEYKNQLRYSARELGQMGVNTMLLGAMLFSLLNFPLPSARENTAPCRFGSPNRSDTTGPWISPDHDLELGWLTFQAGLGPLMRSVLRYLPRAFEFLTTIFSPGRGLMWPNVGSEPPPLPKLWTRFFRLEDDDIYAQLPAPDPMAPLTPSSMSSNLSSTFEETSPTPPLATSVRLLVRMTAFLREIEPTPANSVLYLSFMFKAQRDFRALLIQEHPRAWWLYGYWAGLMCRFDGLWWGRERCQRQYLAVRTWLGDINLKKMDPEWNGEGDGSQLWKDMLFELDGAVKWPPPELEIVVPEQDEEY